MTMLTRGRVILAVCLALLYFSSAVYVRAQAIAAIPRDRSEASLPPVGRSSISPDVPVDSGAPAAASATGNISNPSEPSLPPTRPSSSLDAPVDSGGSAATSGTGIMAVASTSKQETGVDWLHLAEDSLAFLAVSHGFRYATESSTRRQFGKPFFPNYFAAVSNLHGWSDGDPFLVNYVGHPMEGAITVFMWQHNDRAYRTVEFGRNRRYWKERLRGMAFAYVYSVQFEIGPLSEASIGHIQSFYPQVGFVDHVITPTVGLGWAVAEDAIDRKLIQPLEASVPNPWVRLFARGFLNPSRSFANAMTGNLPWHREDRPGVFKPFPESALWAAENVKRTASQPVDPPPGVAPFDFTFHATLRDYVDNANAGPCMGGGGTAGFRTAPEWQIVLDVGGCRMLDFRDNWSGDALTYMVGPRWTPQTSGRWSPHLQALVGGTKLTQEYVNPVLRTQVADWHPVHDEERAAKHAYYSTDWKTAGFAIAAGAGVDYKFNNALALRLANLEYAHSWTNDLNGISYRNAMTFSGGLVLRMGTW